MQPVSPVLPEFNVEETVFAENQPEYQSLPAVRTKDGLVLSRWQFTDEELTRLYKNEASLFLFVWLTTCPRCGEGQPLTPIAPEVSTAREIMERAADQTRNTGEAGEQNGHGDSDISTLLNQQQEATESQEGQPEEVLPAPPSDAEIRGMFVKIWQSQQGQPGYRERRWQELKKMLIARGIAL